MSSAKYPSARRTTIVSAIYLILLSGMACKSASAALIFNLIEGPGLTQLRVDNPTLAAGFRSGFDAAANKWSARFADAVVLNYTIDVDGSLAGNVLGGASSSFADFSYSSVRNALIADQSTATDTSVVSNLVNATAIDMRTNDRDGSVVFDADNSRRNSFLRISRSNAKALGLITANAAANDADITFNENFSFDFDQTDGITTGHFDFTAIATHEIGHAMGFTSGVDIVDVFSANGPNAANDLNGADAGIGDLDDFAIFSTLDLLRFSADSIALGPGVNDLAFGGSSFTSIDGGTTNLASMATGQFNGSGRQASHFASNVNILGPTFGPNSLRSISDTDVIALDAIGFDFELSAAAVPEPSSFAFAVSIGLLFVRRRR